MYTAACGGTSDIVRPGGHLYSQPRQYLLQFWSKLRSCIRVILSFIQLMTRLVENDNTINLASGLVNIDYEYKFKIYFAF